MYGGTVLGGGLRSPSAFLVLLCDVCVFLFIVKSFTII